MRQTDGHNANTCKCTGTVTTVILDVYVQGLVRSILCLSLLLFSTNTAGDEFVDHDSNNGPVELPSQHVLQNSMSNESPPLPANGTSHSIFNVYYISIVYRCC